jgi:hypothetical protein
MANNQQDGKQIVAKNGEIRQAGLLFYTSQLWGDRVMERSVTLIVNAVCIIVIAVMLVTHAQF